MPERSDGDGRREERHDERHMGETHDAEHEIHAAHRRVHAEDADGDDGEGIVVRLGGRARTG